MSDVLPSPAVVLGIEGLTVRYGGVLALADVSLDVRRGSITGLIGPNGAGKTTFIDAVTGFTRVHGGRVRFEGEEVTDEPPHRRARRGLVRTFQSLELFEDLTVRANLLAAAHPPTRWSALTDVLWTKRHERPETDEVLDLLDLAAVAERLPTELSNGQRHVVALARALVSRPTLLLLDEPAAGLDPAETEQLGVLLRRLPGLGATVLVVDHDMALILGTCDHVHVLDFGRLVAGGAPAEIRTDPVVIAAYLGSAS